LYNILISCQVFSKFSEEGNIQFPGRGGNSLLANIIIDNSLIKIIMEIFVLVTVAIL